MPRPRIARSIPSPARSPQTGGSNAAGSRGSASRRPHASGVDMCAYWIGGHARGRPRRLSRTAESQQHHARMIEQRLDGRDSPSTPLGERSGVARGRRERRQSPAPMPGSGRSSVSACGSRRAEDDGRNSCQRPCNSDRCLTTGGRPSRTSIGAPVGTCTRAGWRAASPHHGDHQIAGFQKIQ